MFNDLDTSGMENAKDTLGGSYIKPSDVYEATIKYAYGDVSEKGARSINWEFELADGSTYRETIYVTSNREKGCKPYSEKNGKKTPLPGFSIADSIAQIAAGKSIVALTTEDKVINVYDFDAKGEKPKSVKMLMELLGKKVKLGIIQKKEFKRVEQNGQWVDSTETRDSNNIDAVFHPEFNITVSEAREGKKEAEFQQKWLAKWQGNINDRTAGKGNNAGNAGRPQSGGQTQQAAPSKGLFD